jgi:hypothetical protein
MATPDIAGNGFRNRHSTTPSGTPSKDLIGGLRISQIRNISPTLHRNIFDTFPLPIKKTVINPRLQSQRRVAVDAAKRFAGKVSNLLNGAE